RLLGDLFRLRDLGHHDLRGLAGPVNAWAVEGLSRAESRFDAVRSTHLTGFVGREAEIGLLLDRKSLAWNGEGQIVLISGEPAIRKSRIATALSERVAPSHTRGCDINARLIIRTAPFIPLLHSSSERRS